jgi:hypothetical protein
MIKWSTNASFVCRTDAPGFATALPLLRGSDVSTFRQERPVPKAVGIWVDPY